MGGYYATRQKQDTLHSVCDAVAFVIVLLVIGIPIFIAMFFFFRTLLTEACAFFFGGGENKKK